MITLDAYVLEMWNFARCIWQSDQINLQKIEEATYTLILSPTTPLSLWILITFGEEFEILF